MITSKGALDEKIKKNLDIDILNSSDGLDEAEILEFYRRDVDNLFDSLYKEYGDFIYDPRRECKRAVPDHIELKTLSSLCKSLLFVSPIKNIYNDLSEIEIQKEEIIRHHKLLFALRQLKAIVGIRDNNPVAASIILDLHNDIVEELCKSHLSGLSFPNHSLSSVNENGTQSKSTIDIETEEIMNELKKIKQKKIKDFNSELIANVTESLNKVNFSDEKKKNDALFNLKLESPTKQSKMSAILKIKKAGEMRERIGDENKAANHILPSNESIYTQFPKSTVNHSSPPSSNSLRKQVIKPVNNNRKTDLSSKSNLSPVETKLSKSVKLNSVMPTAKNSNVNNLNSAAINQAKNELTEKLEIDIKVKNKLDSIPKSKKTEESSQVKENHTESNLTSKSNILNKKNELGQEVDISVISKTSKISTKSLGIPNKLIPSQKVKSEVKETTGKADSQKSSLIKSNNLPIKSEKLNSIKKVGDLVTKSRSFDKTTSPKKKSVDDRLKKIPAINIVSSSTVLKDNKPKQKKQ